MHQDTNSYSQQTVAETLDALSVKPEGLPHAEAGKHLEQYGYNKIEEKEQPLWQH